jgi:hypothetical protein
MRSLLGIVAIALLLTGCINISTRTQPDDLTVKAELAGSDCAPIIFNLGYGTADIEKAKLKGEKVTRDPKDNPWARFPITKVRRVEINDLMFLFFGAKCVDVVGEP